MKKVIYVLILLLVVVSGQLSASCEMKRETPKKSITKLLSVAEKKAELKKWEASPDGIMYKKWQASPAGKKVHASEVKIMKSIKDYSDMSAVVTSLSLPPDSRLGFGMMARINGDDYIVSFGAGKNSEFQQLRSLKVNDKIIIKSRGLSHAPKYFYPIVSGDYVARDGKIIYKRVRSKDGC